MGPIATPDRWPVSHKVSDLIMDVTGRASLDVMRPAVIALVGIDGSGKTTQARGLARWLTENGLPATYWQNAGGRRWFGRLARRFGRPDAEALLGRRPMLVIEAALRWLAIARALLRSRLTGRIAVMDRYAVCQYASIRAHGGRGDDRAGSRRRAGRAPDRSLRLARLLYAVFPKPDVTFLLRVRPGVAYQRIEARGTDHERIEFLAASAAAYDALPEAASMVVVDGERPPAEVQEELRQRLRPQRTPLPSPAPSRKDHGNVRA
jgi:thymidylate kinase